MKILSHYPLVPPTNLVPRVHWLFGQREGACRDSGIMAFFIPEKRGIPVLLRMLNFKTENGSHVIRTPEAVRITWLWSLR